MDCKEILKKLAIDHTSSSTTIALKMIDCAVDMFGDDKLVLLVEEIAKKQRSMAVVVNVADRIISSNSKEELVELKNEFIKAEEKAVGQAFEHLKRYNFIATISYSKSVYETILRIRPKKVFVSIGHPAREGELLAEDLLGEKIDVLLFEDAAYGVVADEVDCFLVGADAMLDDVFVNKIGSLYLALLAREFKKPFFVVTNRFKRLEGPLKKLYEIRQMDKNEISRLECDRLNQYFEYVPLRFVDRLFDGG